VQASKPIRMTQKKKKETHLVTPERMCMQGDQGGAIGLMTEVTMISRWTSPSLKVNLIRTYYWIGSKRLKESLSLRTSPMKGR